MQNTSQLLMIEPINFGFNAETALNNAFQKEPKTDVQEKALEEFHAFVKILRNNRISVTVIKDTLTPPTPDSIFPNNWISFHDNEEIFLYPMFAINRRQERKPAVIKALKERFKVRSITDLSFYESQNLFLEGTGSMVLDRDNKIAYACRSPRTDIEVLNDFCNRIDYTAVIFTAIDNGQLIYHTNVLMCIAKQFAVICLDTINDVLEQEKLKQSIIKSGKAIINISIEQMQHFAGNMLQLITTDGELLLVMSTQAYHSLTVDQIAELEKFNRIIHSSLDHIEAAGGGSARCMMAEIFLEPK